MGEMETSMTVMELDLRKRAAKPVFSRLEDDCSRAPTLAPYLKTIQKRLFDPEFNISALCRDHGVKRLNAKEWRALLGANPKGYLTDCRLSVAARLLLHTDLDANRIATLVGYSSPAPFWSAFKPWSGDRTPGQYRENPDQDPHAWPTAMDLSGSYAVLHVPMDRKERLELCQHLLDVTDCDVSELLTLADTAQDTADHEAAIRLLEHAAKHPDRGTYQAAIDGRIALANHCRGTVRTLEGDVDRAYDDLDLAGGWYAQAGVLEPGLEKRRRRLETQVSCTTDNALTSALCPDCRRALMADVGESLRWHLRHALDPVPLDLPWFDVCCDSCYQVTWKALKRARQVLMSDAYHACWLAANVDLGDLAAPASVGRIIAALDEVDSLKWASQEDRLKMCDVALGAAEAVQRPELLLVTRFWRGAVYSALAEFAEARKNLLWKPGRDASPWLRALHEGFMGALEYATTNYEVALDRLQSAAGIYQGLDPHCAGMAIYEQGCLLVDSYEFDEGIALCRRAVRFFDERRDAFPSRVAVPMTVATAMAQLGRLEESTMELNQLCYDRVAYPAVAAVEVFNTGCIAILAGKAREALSAYEDAKRRFERLGNLVFAGLTATCSVEPYCVLGNRDLAISATTQAAQFFEKIGCPRETLAALEKLRALLAEGASARKVAATARRLASRHGGWLPPESHLPSE